MAQESNKLEQLKKDLEEAKAKCEEYLNGWKRERADFINFKKSEADRMSELVKFANEELILKILPILDNIYLAESHIPEGFAEARHLQNTDTDAGLLQETSWLKGFLQIKKQLEDFLTKEGIEPIKTLGEQFDPNFHEVVEEIGHSEALAKDAKPGTIVEEIQRGYTIHGKIIRPAKVKISK